MTHLGLADTEQSLFIAEIHLDIPSPDISLQYLLQGGGNVKKNV